MMTRCCLRTEDGHPRLTRWCGRAVLYCAIVGWVTSDLSRGGDEATSDDSALHRIESAGIENLYRLSPRIYSGAQPEGEDGFKALERLGVRTIISVDGAAPELMLARKHGLRYVHVPIGYDGLPTTQALKIIKAARELPGPVFVHCHHGKHRGPAAAALCAVAVERWSRDKATSWMRTAGTAADYRDLFRSVNTLRIPTDEELRNAAIELPERAPVSSLVEIMVEVDRDWNRLKVHQKAGFHNPDDPDEMTPQQAALQLTERFRELNRQDLGGTKAEGFVAAVRDAKDVTEKLERSLNKLAQSGANADLDSAQAAFRKVAESCSACHKKFRDGTPAP